MSGGSPTSNFSEYPLVVLAAAFAAGVLLAPLTHAPPSVCVTLAALTSASSFFVAFKRSNAAAHLAVLAFACAGAALSSVETKESDGEARLRGLYASGRIASGEPVELTGVLERAPEIAPDGLLLSLRDVDARGTLKSALLVERLDDVAVPVPLALLDAWRTALVRKADAAFSTDAA